MSDTSHRHYLGRSLRLQVNNEDQHSVRGAQLLLAGAILQQYCTAGEGEDNESEDEDESNVIDVRHQTLLTFVLCSQSLWEKKQATVNGVILLFPAGTSNKDEKKKRKSVVTEEHEPKDGGEPPIDILADTIIGFLEKGTVFLRTVANQSFSLLSALLERSTIELMLTVGIILSHDVIVLD